MNERNLHLRPLPLLLLLAACRPGLVGQSPAGPDDVARTDPAVQTDPDAFTKARPVGPGTFADLAVDPKKRIVHMIYVDRRKVLYRQGRPEGVFDEPEVIATSENLAWNYPRIVLDKNGAPHVIFADLVDVSYHGKSNYYSNRIGGHWKSPIKVFDMEEDKVRWALAPKIAVDSDLTVFLATAIGRPRHTKIARLEGVAESPRITLKKDLDFAALNLVMSKGRLLAVGRGKEGEIRTIDKATLELTGTGITFATGRKFEQVRAYADHREDVHIAFANGPGPQRGYYNTLERLEAQKPSIDYASTNRHHSGNGTSVRDLVAPDRVYVFHWSGSTHGEGIYPRCEPDNRVHFVRLENGRKVTELRPITDRPGGHGGTFRAQVAAAPHPDGGVIVVFSECAPGPKSPLFSESSLWFTRVGAYGN